jgi:hypothetical protein
MQQCSRSIALVPAKPPARFLLLGSTSTIGSLAAPFFLRLLPKPSRRCARLDRGAGLEIGRGGFPESGERRAFVLVV